MSDRRGAQPVRGYRPGDHVEASGRRSGSGRACQRCGCNLSRYTLSADCFATHCQPCQRAMRAEAMLEAPVFVADYTLAELDVYDPLEPPAAPAKPPKPPRRRLTLAEKTAQPDRYKPCACGRDYKKRGSPCCAQCTIDKRRTPGSKGSRFCIECGAKKGSNNGARCRDCRYPASEEAQLRRLNNPSDARGEEAA